jgi:hypothetical protein
VEVIFNEEAIGFGDVKFIGYIGTFVGTKGAIFFDLWWTMFRNGNPISDLVALQSAIKRNKNRQFVAFRSVFSLWSDKLFIVFRSHGQ